MSPLGTGGGAPQVELKMQGTAEVVRELKRLKGRGAILAGQKLYQEAEAIMAKSKRQAPVGVHGTLRASGHVQRPRSLGGDRGSEVVLGYGGGAAGYAVYVHEGTGPAVGRPRYFPPPRVLYDWVRKKFGLSAQEAVESAAYRVALAIYRRGTEPRKFLEQPFNEAIPGMADRIAAHVRRGMGA